MVKFEVTFEVVEVAEETDGTTEEIMEETVTEIEDHEAEEKIETIQEGLVVEAVIVVDADVDLHHTVRCHEADLVLKALQGEDVVVVEGQDLAQDQSDDSKNIGGDRLQ